MVQISEFMPNPVGSDTSGEWVELINTNPAPVSLEGWAIANSSNKPKLIYGQILGNSFRVLPRSETKLALKNTDETISIYNAQGALIDQASFSGAAPEGQSYSRTNTGFIVTQPTPGKANQTALSASLIQTTPFKFQNPIHPISSESNIVLAGLVLGIICTGSTLYFLQKSHDLSQLFFGSN